MRPKFTFGISFPDPTVFEKAKERANVLGLSFSAYVNQVVRKDLGLASSFSTPSELAEILHSDDYSSRTRVSDSAVPKPASSRSFTPAPKPGQMTETEALALHHNPPPMIGKIAAGQPTETFIRSSRDPLSDDQMRFIRDLDRHGKLILISKFDRELKEAVCYWVCEKLAAPAAQGPRALILLPDVKSAETFFRKISPDCRSKKLVLALARGEMDSQGRPLDVPEQVDVLVSTPVSLIAQFKGGDRTLLHASTLILDMACADQEQMELSMATIANRLMKPDPKRRVLMFADDSPKPQSNFMQFIFGTSEVVTLVSTRPRKK